MFAANESFREKLLKIRKFSFAFRKLSRENLFVFSKFFWWIFAKVLHFFQFWIFRETDLSEISLKKQKLSNFSWESEMGKNAKILRNHFSFPLQTLIVHNFSVILIKANFAIHIVFFNILSDYRFETFLFKNE